MKFPRATRPESGPPGFVRGAHSNMRPYRDDGVLGSLAADLADFAVVPFVGAGCSLGLTKEADWKAVTDVLAGGLELVEWTSETVVAQTYEDRFGREALVTALRERLTLSAFDDERGATHLALLCLHFPAIYTTNVENAIELGHTKYGRPLNVVSELNDLRNVVPGRTVLYKYHGDLQHPANLVWTEGDYARRKAREDFVLNVRLRSDLLTKKLLFVGYSVRDPHIVELLAMAQRLYADGIRGGVVIAAGKVDPVVKTEFRDFVRWFSFLASAYRRCSLVFGSPAIDAVFRCCRIRCRSGAVVALHAANRIR